MLVASLLSLAGTQAATSAVISTARSAGARAALPAAVFPPGLAIVDERGEVVGKVISADQGLVTIKTAYALVGVPASAFVMRGGPVMVGIPAAQVESLARTGVPSK